MATANLHQSTNPTTERPDGSDAPGWVKRISPDAREFFGDQLRGEGETCGGFYQILGQGALIEEFRRYGCSAPDAEAATDRVLLVRRRKLLKALSGEMPKGMRDGPESLLARLPGPMTKAIGDTATLGAVLLGPTGCGKTTAAGLLALRCAPSELHWCYATDLAMADRYHKLGAGEPEAIQTARKAKALVLDDIGVESSSALWTILNHRYHEGLPTIATSGLTRDELTSAIGAAAVRRLRDQHAGHEVLIVDLHEVK